MVRALPECSIAVEATGRGGYVVPWWLWVLVGVGGLLAVFFAVGAWSAAQPARLRRAFSQRRRELHDEFFAAASASGKPRGLRWKALDWTVQGAEPEPLLARELGGGFVALLPATIQFEAVEGGDMEGLPAVGNLRNATAVFHWRQGRWQTDGRAVFNLNPDEALAHYKDQYAPLGEPRGAGPSAGRAS
jgi:hypothetical protein